MGKSYSIDEFKELMVKKNPFKLDDIDFENGRMTIHRCNIDKYLEKYACKDEFDLSDTMWHSFGCFVKVVD